MNVIVTGGSGQLGSEIKELSKNYQEHVFYFTDVKDLDITNEERLRSYIIENQIDAIINCAAYTAVDQAEEERVIADRVNGQAVKFLSRIAKEKKLRFIHISTDYVFDGAGSSPYQVTSETKPVNYYGASKLSGEQFFLANKPSNSLLIRTSWVYSSYGNNFVKTMLRLGAERTELHVIDDQIGSPTYAADLAAFVLDKGLNYESKEVGVYHFTNEGVCSWYDFAVAIMRLAGLDCHINPIPTSAYPTKAKRPHYSVLDKTKLKKEFDYTIPHWQESLTRCIYLLKKH